MLQYSSVTCVNVVLVIRVRTGMENLEKLINYFKERRSKYKTAYALNLHNFQKCSCLYRDFSLVVDIWFKVL